MLKKMLCLLTALLVVLTCVPAFAAQTDALTLEELTDWVEGYRQMAMESAPLNDPHDADALTEDGYAFVYDFGTLYFDTPELTEASVLNGVVVYDLQYPGPRGTEVGCTLSSVLDAFRNDNAELVGNHDAAVLYMDDEEAAGVVLRDGQRILAVQYAVFDRSSAAGVIYTLQDDLVAAIRAWGLNGQGDEAMIRAELDELTATKNAMDYRSVLSSLDGSQLTMFGPADLTLCGLDLTSVTPEQAESVLGPMLEDIWEDNEDGGYIRTIDFQDCEMTFLVNAAKDQAVLMMLDVTIDGLEGPRGVRVGDTLSSVLCRFRHGEGEFDGATEVLYGGVGQAVSGVVEYGQTGAAILRYTQPIDGGRTAMLMVSFEQLIANEVLLYFGE